VESEKKTLEKKASRQMDNEMMAEVAQLRAEKTTWSASMEQAGKEKRFYMENGEQLRKEVVQLQVQKEKTYTDQIHYLEKQVRELSSQLVDAKEITRNGNNCHINITNDPAKNAETQTPHLQPLSGVSDNNYEMTEELAGLARLEENRAMLLRTGVYRETDHVVVKLSEQIEKLRDKLGVGGRERR
jgi:uncharacterized protein with NAD-binding domain and iron-sulfur cluster